MLDGKIDDLENKLRSETQPTCKFQFKIFRDPIQDGQYTSQYLCNHSCGTECPYLKEVIDNNSSRYNGRRLCNFPEGEIK